MNYELKECSRNSHKVIFDVDSTHVNTAKIALLSDLHWDNPKCDRATLKEHLDKAVQEGRAIYINGDLFCLMQGRYDPRRSKKDIRPEHNVGNYLDAVIEDAVEWFKPYAENIAVIGYGNHETSIIKNLETDPLQRFVDLLNERAKPKTKVAIGGYGGWIQTQLRYKMKKGRDKVISHYLKYFHGSGGGGPVTRGQINLTRINAFVEGADMIWLGHVHEDTETTITVERLSCNGISQQRDVKLVITPAYKEEYDGHYMGYHTERGRPPKPIGCRFMDIEMNLGQHQDRVVKHAYTYSVSK